MPSVRNLKKDIDCLLFEVISDSFTYGSIHPEERAEEIMEIVSDAAALRNDLIKRANNPEKSTDPKVRKKYFQTIEKDLFVGVDRLCGRLSAITGKNE